MNTNSEELTIDIPLPIAELALLAGDAFFQQVVSNHLFRSCINCDNFEADKSFCKHYNTNPPAHVIVFSCKTNAWKADVPF